MAKRTVIYGLNSVLAALRAADGRVIRIWLDAARDDGRAREVLEVAGRDGLKVQRCGRSALEKVCGTPHHQGAALEWLAPAVGTERDLRGLAESEGDALLLLVLDGVQDPHNLGACLRTADGAGVSAVVVPRARAVGLTPTVCKVASGAVDSVRLLSVTNLARTLRELQRQGVWVTGFDERAQGSLYDTDLRGALALVLGGEGSGLRRLTRERCDRLVRIPMTGKIESLNVSVSAGVALFEAVRQRRSGKL
jgi:23S rRNA (guanosine2251-2'-O)-methyltransferase